MINIGIKIIQKLYKPKIMYIKELNNKDKGRKNWGNKIRKNNNKDKNNKKHGWKNKWNKNKKEERNLDNLLLIKFNN